MMGRNFLPMKLPTIALLAASLLFSSTTFAGTCTGSDDCTACKSCRYCKHCAKEGGTCGMKKRLEQKQ